MKHLRPIPLVAALALAWAMALPAAAKTRPKAPSVPAGAALSINSSQGQIFQPDPKSPGHFLWKIWMQGITGSSVGGGFEGTLTGVTAYLFQKGAASARLTAPTARGDSAQQTIVASGRVHVVSLDQPGTTLVADTVTWQAKTNTIIAVGNVIYRNGKTGLTMRVPRLNADTVLKSISFGRGDATLR